MKAIFEAADWRLPVSGSGNDRADLEREVAGLRAEVARLRESNERLIGLLSAQSGGFTYGRDRGDDPL